MKDKIKNLNKAWIVIGVVVVVVLVFVLATRGSNGNLAVSTVEKSDLIKTVKVSGKVVPVKEVSLGFETGGTVSAVYKDTGDFVSTGDIIAELDGAVLKAGLSKAQADLTAAKAELSKLQGGQDLEAKVSNATNDATQAVFDAYSEADSAIHGKADQLFKDARTANPRIVYFFDNSDLERSINTERVAVETTFGAWASDIARLRSSAYTNDMITKSVSHLRVVAAFLDDLAKAVSNYKETDGLSQTSIDKYKTDIASARTSVNSSLSNLIAKSSTLSDVIADVPVQVARVSSAQADVANYEAQIGNLVIKAPFSGVISKQDAKVGQSAVQNAAVVSLISKDYKVEAFVPEVSIAGIALGNVSAITLDAYGSSVVFSAKVSHIDPAETIRDGVSNYRIELAFSKPDGKVKSGMTANVSIETLRKEGILTVPLRAVVTADGVSRVYVKEDKAISEKIIETGISDSSGNTEVLSGLSEGESVLLDPLTSK